MARVDSKPDQKVFDEYGLRGFPTTLLIDHDGSVLWGKETFWRPSDKNALESGLMAVERLFKLRTKVAERPDDLALRANLTLLDGLFKPQTADLQAMEAASKLDGIDPDLRDRFQKMAKRLPFQQVFESYRVGYRATGDKAERERLRTVAVKKSYQLLCRDITIEDPGDSLFRPYWALAFDGAIAAADLVQARRAFDVYLDEFGEGDRYIQEWRVKLEALKAKGT